MSLGAGSTMRAALTAISLVAGCVVAVGHAAALEVGVNLSGLEFNAGAVPGRPNWDYPVPSEQEIQYYAAKGITYIRVPVLWERLQPGLLSGQPALDPAYLQLIVGLLQQAARHSVGVIVDVHDYGGYAGHKLGDGTLNLAKFVNFWGKLAHHLAGQPALLGYDLMNEPEGLPSAATWPQAAQAAVNTIRVVDQTTPIFIEGDNWASAASWQQVNGALAIHDPADRLVYEAHVYGDRDNSGTHYAWAEEQQYGVTVQTIAERLGQFTAWCSAGRYTCIIGEVGVGNDDPNWNIELANGLAAAKMGGLVGATYWAAGPWWGSYPLNIEPQNGVDAPQMSVVDTYASPPLAMFAGKH